MLTVSAALAAPAAQVQAELDAPEGWVLHSEREDLGIVVYSKPIPSLGVTGFMGVKTLAAGVDSDALLDLITDVGRHAEINSALADSTVLERDGDASVYFQVLAAPPLLPVSPRYWISSADATRDIGGQEGHHKRVWNSLPEDALPEVRAEILDRFPRAVPLTATHGSWEMIPSGDGTTLIYRSVGDPGGAVPAGVISLLSGRTLPDTMVVFEQAAREN
jgi:hypothetical protein